MKNNYCKCFYGEGYFFIILNENLTDLSKIVIEVGNFDEEKKFNLMYILVINSDKDFKICLDIMKQIGIKNYFDCLIFNDRKIVTLEDYGYIYRYYEQPKNDSSNDFDNFEVVEV